MANAKGVDVSHWQALSDWSAVGISFVIVKASEGTWPDPKYAKHVAKGRENNLVVGAYAFNDSRSSIAEQAKFFADTSKDADLWFIDVEARHVKEADGSTTTIPAFTTAQTKEFIAYFKNYTGKHIGLYHSASGFFDAGQDYDWIAHWGVDRPSRAWDFHQYRGSPLDLDQFNGTEDELRAFVNRMNGVTMPTLSQYIPGYVATVGPGSNVRPEPSLAVATTRTTTKNEKWTVVGWAVGDEYGGSTKWLCRYASNRWEYTHEVNVTVAPAEVPPTATECKPFSDAAYADGAASRQDEVSALAAEVTRLDARVTVQNSIIEDQRVAIVSKDNIIESLISENDKMAISLEAETTRANNAELLASRREMAIQQAYDYLSEDPMVKALSVLEEAP